MFKKVFLATVISLSLVGQAFAVTPVTITKSDGSGGVSITDGKLDVNSTGTSTVSGTVTANQGTGGSSAWKVDGSAVTQPVSATNLDIRDLTSASDSVEVKQSTASNLKVDLSGTGANSTALKVDGSAVTQPVSGTFWQATQPVSIATMPSTPVTGTFWQATQPVSGTVTANQGGTWNIGSVTTLPAITGAVDLNPATDNITGQKNVASSGTRERLVIATTAGTTQALPACTYNEGTLGVGATLTGVSNGALTAQDGVTLIATNTLLVKNQASAFQNGVYTVTQVGDETDHFILTRLGAYDEQAEIMAGTIISVLNGTANGNKMFQQTTVTPTIGVSNIVFSQLTTMLSVTVTAKPTNTGYIYMGNQYVTSSIGKILSAKESQIVDVDNLSDVWLDCSVNGEGVSYEAVVK